MGINFPASPTLNQKYPQPAVAGIPVYTWDGEKWTTVGGSIAAYAPPADAVPLMDATPGLVGTTTEYAREDHVHPVDTKAVRTEMAQSLTATQQTQARSNIGVPGSNVVINGDFRVNQAGYASAAVLAAGAYGHDQWKAGAGGGNYSFTQLKSSTQITIASGKSLIQPIEDVSVVGGSYVLTWTGTAQARAGVDTLTPAGAYAASPLSITGQTAGTAMSVEFNNGTLGTVKLESGASATPFIMRPYGEELVTCQRYYRRIGGDVAADLQLWGYAPVGGALLGMSQPLSPVMRAAPTLAKFGTFTESNLNSNSFAVSKTVFGWQIGAAAAGAFYSYANVGGGFSLDARL